MATVALINGWRLLVKKYIGIFAALLTLGSSYGIAAHAGAPARSNAESKHDPSDTGKAAKYIYENNCTVLLRAYVIATDGLGTATVSSSAEGSGSLISVDGEPYILTNAHVVNEYSILWAFFSHTLPKQEVEVYGYDPITDLALLRFKNRAFKAPCAIPLGNSSALNYGDEVFTFGSTAPIEYFMFSKGFVMKNSSANEGWKDDADGLVYLQPDIVLFDANLNPGYSGSPLINSSGELVGLNSGQTGNLDNRGNSVAIAIAVDHIKRALPALKRGGTVKHGMINVRVIDSRWTTPTDRIVGLEPQFRDGPVVTDVAVFSSASRNGLEVGDLIVAIDNTPTPTAKDFYIAMLFRLKPETVAKLTILRKNEYRVLKMPIEEFFERNAD